MKRLAALSALALVLSAATALAQPQPLSLPDDLSVDNAEDLAKWALIVTEMFDPSIIEDDELKGWRLRLEDVRLLPTLTLVDPPPADTTTTTLESIMTQIESVIVIGNYTRSRDASVQNRESIMDLIVSDDPGVDQEQLQAARRLDKVVEELALTLRVGTARVYTKISDPPTPPAASDRIFRWPLTLDDEQLWLDQIDRELAALSDQLAATEDSSTSSTGGSPLSTADFVYAWQGGLPDLTWEELSSLADADVRALLGPIAIPAYADEALQGPDTNYFPFPDQQFVLAPPDESTGGAHCANEHYEGSSGLDVTGATIPQPDGVCAWGSPAIGTGVLLLDADHLADWLARFSG